MASLGLFRGAAAAVAFGALSAVAAPGGAAAQTCAAPNVTIASITNNQYNAQVCGTVETATVNSSQIKVNAYKGIPYAVPPTAANNARWQAPQKLTPNGTGAWTGTLQATRFAPICPQGSAGGQQESEDCLYLNVYVPASATATSKLPVMVFIHGGAFVEGAGSAPIYDGAYLAASGNVIVVTLNYRLGALGFLYANHTHIPLDKGSPPSILIPGNFGLLDQQQAMLWVNANIAAFGGNPGQVTIFGESAGAMSVGLHLFSVPSSNSKSTATGSPLFQAAIMESNPLGVSYRTPADFVLNPDGEQFLNILCSLTGNSSGCWPSGASAQATWLQSFSTNQVMAAQAQFEGAMASIRRIAVGGMVQALPWAPVVDQQVVMSQPYNGYYTNSTNGNLSTVPHPLLMGFNQNEGATFAGLTFSAAGGTFDATTYGALVDRAFPNNGGTVTQYVPPGASVAPYSASAQAANAPSYYSTYSCVGNACVKSSDGAPVAFGNMITDNIFKCANIYTANNALKGNQPVYAYLFAQPPQYNLYGSLPSCSVSSGNVCHANELPYVFNTIANEVFPVPASDAALAQQMSKAWTSFATSQTPGVTGWSAFSSSAANIYTLGGSNNGTLQTNLAVQANCAQSTSPTTQQQEQLWFNIPPFVVTAP